MQMYNILRQELKSNLTVLLLVYTKTKIGINAEQKGHFVDFSGRRIGKGEAGSKDKGREGNENPIPVKKRR